MLKTLDEYVERRAEVLQRIGAWYGVPPRKCKFAVLRVLNGGSIGAWVRSAKCTRNHNDDSPDLRALVAVAEEVRAALFRMERFRDHVSPLFETLHAERAAALREAKSRLSAAERTGSPEEKRDAARCAKSAQMRSTVTAIRRTIFSLCVFELEDAILDVVDRAFAEERWVVASLQYDGCHVEHRPDADLAAAMRRAEAAVRVKLGYRIQLAEKPLFEAVEDGAALLEENDALMSNEVDE